MTKNPLTIIAILVFIGINFVNIFMGGDPTREGKMVFFILAALLAGATYVHKNIHGYTGILLGYASLLWFIDGLHIYGTLLCVGSLGFLLLANEMVMNAEEELFSLLRISLWIQLGASFLELVGFHPFLMGGVQGTLGHPMAASVFLAMLLPFCVEKWTRWETALTIIIILAMGSTTGILGMVAALYFYLYRRNRKISLLLGAVGGLACTLGAYFLPEVEFFSFSGRFLPWSAAWNHIAHGGWHAVFGYGPGSWFGLYGCQLADAKSVDCSVNHWGVGYTRIWDFLHSDPLQLLLELGIVGFGIALVGILDLLRRSKTWVGASLSAIFVNSLGAFPFHLPVSGFLFCVLLALTKKHGKINYA